MLDGQKKCIVKEKRRVVGIEVEDKKVKKEVEDENFKKKLKKKNARPEYVAKSFLLPERFSAWAKIL